MHRSSSYDNISRISAAAQRAARAENWTTVKECTQEILKQDKRHPEAWFLTGLMEKAEGRNPQAVAAFSQSLQLDSKRFDAAIELAGMCQKFLRDREAIALLQRYVPSLANHPHYLDLAGTIYTNLGLHEKAWPLFRQANELQPDIDHFQVNLAACAARTGRKEQAGALYHALLARHPGLQRSHYDLACLEKANDSTHVDWMKEILDSNLLPAGENIYLHRAIAKELEDLQQWEESFDHYQIAADATSQLAADDGHDVSREISVIDKVIEVCNPAWLLTDAQKSIRKYRHKSPLFIVGLPGSATAFMGQIISSHSKVENAGETPFMPIVIRRAGGAGREQKMSPEIIGAAAKKDAEIIANAYLDAVDYKLHGLPMFTDSLPENILNLGFIAKAFPHAQFINVQRNPLDACFEMYKQPSPGFANSLEELGRYSLAYDRLRSHWKKVLQDRYIEVELESLLANPEEHIRDLLARLDLDFEPACLEFEADAATVNSWKNWEDQLQSLKGQLEGGGISL